MERDVCDLVISVNLRISQPFVDETRIGHVLVAKTQHASKVAPVATLPPHDNPNLQDAEADRIFRHNIEAFTEAQ